MTEFSVNSPTGLPALPCPECREAGVGGGARIGNNRNRCRTCNNFGQNVMRLSRRYLIAKFPEEYRAIRMRTELDLYPQVIEDYSQRRGLTDEADAADAAEAPKDGEET